MQQVFVYGSLLFTEIVQALTGTNFTTKEGVLHGFKRCTIHGADYPALVHCKETSVKGKVLQNVDSRSLEILKFYEGDEYECIPASVLIENKTMDALVFVWKGNADFLNGAWDEKAFEEASLENYLNEIVPETRLTFDSWQAKAFNQH
ncbi:MAG: gamma-glutamylcyclotransferase family protein [Draconibacterium sp.]